MAFTPFTLSLSAGILGHMNEITRALHDIRAGKAQAADLLPLVYDELRALAAAKLAREKPGHTLDATALVHEAYLRVGHDDRFDHRGHFFAAAAEAMRRILVDGRAASGPRSTAATAPATTRTTYRSPPRSRVKT